MQYKVLEVIDGVEKQSKSHNNRLDALNNAYELHQANANRKEAKPQAIKVLNPNNQIISRLYSYER